MTTTDEVPGGDTKREGLGTERRVRMTLRVSRDSGRTWGRLLEVLEDENPVIAMNSGNYPPCSCLHCTSLPSRERS
ncbi:exo-alpha-sialidase [Streptomyces sp. J2-1]|uniref:exo-alpha-sialidase n=1 Tax=Streptomyces corallincola TaxID=2851888 RepID=UPI001C392EFA|nr:exo-alpha-sialidase [Streptomyces corallincola]MBV2355996.1 exo-alpha-sialidase [Streptomyces corallincola]